MNRKELIFTLCAGLFVLHFSMTIMHDTPDKYLSPRMQSYSHLWCFPVFHQGWALFAPAPQDMTKHLDMRFKIDGHWSEWYRAEDICMDQHLKYRVTHYSKLCHVAQNATYHLWLELDRFHQQESAAEEYFPLSSGYAIATHFAQAYAFHYLDNPSLDSLDIKLVLQDPFERSPEEDYSFPIQSVDAP